MIEVNGIQINETAFHIALCWEKLPPGTRRLIWSIVNSYMDDGLELRREDIDPSIEKRLSVKQRAG